jgi:hypothetical protein
MGTRWAESSGRGAGPRLPNSTRRTAPGIISTDGAASTELTRKNRFCEYRVVVGGLQQASEVGVGQPARAVDGHLHREREIAVDRHLVSHLRSTLARPGRKGETIRSQPCNKL